MVIHVHTYHCVKVNNWGEPHTSCVVNIKMMWHSVTHLSLMQFISKLKVNLKYTRVKQKHNGSSTIVNNVNVDG